MSSTVTIPTLPLDFFQLRVLLWKDERGIFVSQCLETGSVATADDLDTLRDITLELLTDEVDYNLNDMGSLGNLFGTPAPVEVWRRYYDLRLNRSTDYVSGITMLDGSY